MSDILILLLLSEFLYRLFDAEMDTIKFRLNECWFNEWEWYTSNNWQTGNWFLKVPFSMFLDGWHFIKFLMQMVRIIPLIILINLLYHLNIYVSALILIGVYAYGGAVWEITYGRMFR